MEWLESCRPGLRQETRPSSGFLFKTRPGTFAEVDANVYMSAGGLCVMVALSVYSKAVLTVGKTFSGQYHFSVEIE